MPRSSNIPPAILSFVKKSTAPESGGHGEDDDDHAFLLPSAGSSFNLQGDSEFLLSKSTSHHSNNSRSSHSKASSSRASTTSSAGERRHLLRRHNSDEPNIGRSNRRGGSDGAAGARSKRKKRSSPKQHESHGIRRRSPKNYEKQHTDPFPEKESRTLPLIKSSSTPLGQEEYADHDDDYMLGYDNDSDNIPRGLSPIAASTSFHSENSGGIAGSIHSSVQSGASEFSQSNRSLRSPSIHTIHSGKSYRSRKSEGGSNRSGKRSSSRTRRAAAKMKREEKRREYIQRWRRRRFVGTMALTVIYSILFAYTLLVTLGPLMLSFRDPMEWCPYYNDDLGLDFVDPGYSLNIDQLQQSKLLEEEEDGANVLHRRRLASQSNAFSTTNDLKRVEIDLLRKTSKDVHTNGNNPKDDTQQSDLDESTSKYENPDYNNSPCHLTRIPYLFYLTLEECDLSRRMAASVLLGGFIGYERRASDRPAGIRTMSLVSLGSCFFTISSQLAFRDSPMTWDSSRVTAAIPSGVGFLGAGLIWKGSLSDGSGGEVHQVHGITTAASVWLAAAVGVGAGGALYAVSAYSTALVIIVLRFGPRLYLQHDKGFEDDDEDEDYEESEDGDAGKYGDVPEEMIPAQTMEQTGITHRHNYEMHQMGTNDTTNLKTDATTRYGSTDVEQNIVTQILQHDQRRLERLNRLEGGTGNTNDRNEQPQFLSWLTNMLPGRGRQQPANPYQEILRDREVMRMMKKKTRSLGKINSRPSFCT